MGNIPKKENEVSVWSVAVGNLPLNPFKMRAAEKALLYIRDLEGFIGIHPIPPRGTLCLFRSENEAKGARNLMRAKGIQTGNNICELYVDKLYILQAEQMKKENEKNKGGGKC